MVTLAEDYCEVIKRLKEKLNGPIIMISQVISKLETTIKTQI